MATVTERTIERESMQSIVERKLLTLTFKAKRQVPVVGTAEYPTGWDLQHQRIDDALDDWQTLTGRR